MAKKEFTGLRDNLPSKYHRYIGDRCYMTDIDALMYSYENGKIKFAAVVDWKNENMQYSSMNFSPMKAQEELARQLNIPFFMIITYLDRPIKMWFVKPCNNKALDFIEHSGVWMSAYEFSMFSHGIRGLIFNEEEIIKGEGYKLKDLPHDKTIYKLPDFR